MERDPLIQGGTKKIIQHESGAEAEYEPHSKTILHAALLGLAPFFIFIAMLAVMFELWHGYTAISLLIITCLVTLNVGFAVFEMAHGKAWLWWVGVLGTLAIFCGLGAGLFNYYKYLLYFNAYSDMRKYTNVAGSQHAAEFGDAAMFLFTKDTAVDTTSAVGYQDPKAAGRVFCVAPIIDGSMTKNDMISFWAVGENYCEERANFECDASGDASAKSGLVLLAADKLVSSALAWAVAGGVPTEQYKSAIRLQNAVFGSSNAKKNVFVRWTKDPVQMQDLYWQEAFSMATLQAGLYFVLSMIMGISAALQARPPPKHLGD